jgi:single-strand DNA-binding protein
MHQQIEVIGNVGKDPEMRFIPSGTAVCSFSVAANSQYTNSQGEQVKETVWFRVTTWGKQAEVCKQYVTKGMLVLVIGKLTPDKATGGPRIWTTSDGKPAASFEVNASTVRFLSGGKGKAEQQQDAPPEEDLPF